MKHFLSLLITFSGCALTALAPATANAQGERGRGRDQVCVYEHADYGGWEQCYGIGETVRDLGSRRNSISSIRVQGRAEITLFQHPDFQGNEVTISESIPDVRRFSRGWNDETDSLRVGAAGFGGRPERAERRADRVCVYQHTGFQGKSTCFDAGDEEPDLNHIGWNDGISSIRVFGHTRLALFEHANFDGERLIVEEDIPDLTRVGTRNGGTWNDRISSLRVGEERGGRRR